MIRIQFAGAGVKLAGKGLMCNEEFVGDDCYLDSVCHIETADFMIDIGETVAELTVEIYDENTIQGTDSIRIVPDRVIMPTTTNTSESMN